MTFLDVTVCSNSILTAICTTELQNITKIVSWGRPRCSAELIFLFCFPPDQFTVPHKYRCHLKDTQPVWHLVCLSEEWRVCDSPPICTPSFLLCPLCDIVVSSNKAVFKGCVALQGKPDRRGYLPVRKAALLGVQSGAAAMCWVSFTPSFARRSMFGVLKMQPMPPDIIQRVFQGNKKLYTYLYFWKFLLFEDSQEIFF